MNASRCILAAILAAMSCSAVVHAQHVHAGPVHADQVRSDRVRSDPAPVPGSHSPVAKWATDAPLRTGMRGARDVVDALEHGRHGHLDPDQVRRLAAQLEGHVQDIFANCRLEPKADAALHDILLPLLTGARALATDPADMRPLASMQRAVEAYALGFDDPGFQPH